MGTGIQLLSVKNQQSMRWTRQEEDMLKKLKEELEVNCWEKIAKHLNMAFHKTNKTGRQCREKYINFASFFEENEKSNDWTLEEERILFNLYRQSGPAWSSFIPYLVGRPEGCIKNKFYNKLRKFSRKIEQLQKIQFKNCRSSINYNNLTTILELGFQIQQWMKENNNAIRQETLLETTKEKILQICFMPQQKIQNKEISELIVNLKLINKQLRCLGIFKTKNKKSWKLSQQRVNFILKISNSYKEDSSLSKTAFSQSESSFQHHSSTEQQLEISLIDQNEDLESLLPQKPENENSLLFQRPIFGSDLFLQILNIEDTNDKTVDFF